MSNRTVEATLRISGKANTAGMAKQVNRDLDSINRRALEFNKRSGVIGRVQERARTIGTASGVAIAAAAYGAKQALVDFAAVERQMNRIGNNSSASSEEVKAAFSELQQQARQLALPLDQAIEGLDTLVASGMTLKEAMTFLPSVLATAQASGAATEDVANAGLKAASAFKIAAPQMQHAFDLMVAGGQAGQYELKDMAGDIPRLANLFATLGYTGEDGLKRLVAILQTIREDTGSSEEAATAAENVFNKMYSNETSNKFKKFGIDLRSEMKKSAESGEDALTGFIRITRKALGGDMTNLGLLFEDTQAQAGMRSLLTSSERLAHYMDELGNPSVNGTVYRNLQKIIADTQGSIDKFNASYEAFKLTLTSAVIAPVAAPIMDAITKNLTEQDAMNRGMEKRGYSKARQLFGFTTDEDAMDLKYEGGYRDPDFLKNYWAYRYGAGKAQASTGGPHAMPPREGAEFPGGDRHINLRQLPEHDVPVPGSRPERPSSTDERFISMQRQYQQYGQGRQQAQDILGLSGKLNVFEGFEKRLEQGGQQAGQAIEQSGSRAGDAIAGKMNGTADQIGAKIAGYILEAVSRSLGSIKTAGPTAPPRVNADLGRSMPPQSLNGGGGGGF
ncbi:phage tail tape measure protein [Rhizobium beringeri]|uniref:phage tail tape measure protein n=1 Tax=Rhizobium beringeri TaxID=3019934 RepID=UPI002E138973|nr:phage tail tape measure protein [Rhizobium beringeri]